MQKAKEKQIKTMGNTPTMARDPPHSAPDSAQHNAQGILHDHAGDSQEFTCEICIEPMLIPEKRFKNGDRCAHPFCTDCVIKYIRVKVEDDNAGHIKCPGLNCDHTLDPHACAPLIGPSLFSRWCDVLCEAAILGVDKCYCPDRNCNTVILNECGGDLRKSSCPNCKRLFCFRCKMDWHEGFWCEDMGEVRDSDDLAFDRLAKRKGWRRCPSCGHFVERVRGCQFVNCRCRTGFCYKCGRQGREHYCPCAYTTRVYCVWVFVCFIVICLAALVIGMFLLSGGFRYCWGSECDDPSFTYFIKDLLSKSTSKRNPFLFLF